MIYCKRCLYPSNHPYGFIVDQDGVCSGCRIHEEKDYLDWAPRLNRLDQIVETFRTSKNYDCIVPVKGGGDSYYILHVVKRVLGLNPLLVHFNQEYNTQVGLRNLGNLSTVFDCDMVTSTANPDLLRRVCRATLQQYGSMYWHCLAGSLTFPVQIAVKYKIPLIIWGVHPFSDQVGMFSHLDEVEMTEKCRREHGLMSISAEDVINPGANVTRTDMQHFVYPYENELERVGVRGIYLSNFIRWDSKRQHEKMIDLYGYESAEQQRTFNTYEDVHCMHSAGLHDYLKFIKLGYGKVTDHATREIRLRRMSRPEGVEMVRKYATREPKDLDCFLDWIGMTRDELFSHIWDRRDPRAWSKRGSEWHLRDSIINHDGEKGADKAALSRVEDCVFRLTGAQEPGVREDRYTLMGRCYFNDQNYGAVACTDPEGGLSERQYSGYLHHDFPHMRRELSYELL